MARSLQSQQRNSKRKKSSKTSNVRLKFTLPDADSELFDTLEDLLRQTWTIFCVSTLFDFKRDESHLKKYAKRLREEVAANLSHENVSYNAKFYIPDETAARPSLMDPPAVKIEVHSTAINEEEEIEKCIYKGVLLSWNSEQNEDTTKDSLRMPLLLCRGTRGTMDIVHATLGKLFDCMIIAMPATVEDLMWLMTILISHDDRKVSDEVKAEYTVPGLPVTESITVKYRVKELTNILDVIKEGEKDVIELKDIERFHECLHMQMLGIASVQLGLCTLRRITLPSITIMENRMKITHPETMNTVLLYLNEKALNLCHTL